MNLKELLDIVRSELRDLSSLEKPDFRLEQAQFNQEEKNWEVVVSYLVENTNPKSVPLATLKGVFEYHRVYKEIKIDENKKVVGFYIFEHQ